MHTPITFTIKAYNADGVFVDSEHYSTPKLNQFNGHWCVVERIMNTLSKRHGKKAKAKRVSSFKVFMDDVEYVYDQESIEWVKA